MIKTETISKLAEALVKAQKNMGAAVKDSKNPFFKSNYADLGSVIDASVPSLNAEGIAALQMTVHENGKNFVRTLLLHESGEFLGSDTEIICAKQNDPQALGSAITYSRRYSLQSMVTLKAEDDDGEKAMSRPGKATAPVQLARPAPQPVDELSAALDAPVAKKSSFRKAAPKVEIAAEPLMGDESEVEGWS
jgi:hypothetical protein